MDNINRGITLHDKDYLNSFDNPVKPREKLAYGLGSLGKDFIMAMLTTYLLVFYTDVLGISAAAGGTIILFARIWDGINDPMIGAIADRTRSRWGRFRPYLLFVPIPFVIFSVLTFTVPDLSVSGKIVWAAVTYIGAGMLFTAYDVPLWAMVPSLTQNKVIRNQLISLARIFTMIGFLVISVLALPLISMLGGEDQATGYQRLMIITGMISVVFAWITFFSTRERIAPSKSSPDLKDYIYIIKSNPTLFILLLAYTAPLFGQSIASTIGVYAMTYWIGKPELIPAYMLIMLLGMIAGMASAPSVVKHMGNRKTVVTALVVAPAPFIVVFFVGQISIVALLIFYFAGAFLFGIPEVVIPAMIADSADLSAQKTGVRADGVIFSLNSFIQKVGLALGGGTAGLVLGWSGYVPNAPVQPDSALMAISLIWTVIPGVICLLGALPLIRIGKKDKVKSCSVTLL